MKIKNTTELVRRARWHARQDHVRQGTYGEIETNGKIDFEGCAIGCLATPHRQKDLWAAFRTHGGMLTEVSFQLETLEDDFGICNELARCAEAIFENFPYHGEAIEFIPRFAEALNEGAEIDEAMLRDIWPGIVEPDEGTEAHKWWDECLAADDYTWVSWAGATEPDVDHASVASARFLKWLRERKPQAVTA